MNYGPGRRMKTRRGIHLTLADWIDWSIFRDAVVVVCSAGLFFLALEIVIACQS